MNKVLGYLFLCLLVAVTGYEVSAQGTDVRSFRPNNNPANRLNRSGAARSKVGTKLEAARNKYLSQQLDLNDDESRRFWPLYRKYQQELTAVRILKRLNNSNPQPNGTEQVDKELYYDNQLLGIRKRYRDEFVRILPSEKVNTLYKSEHEFNSEVIKQLSERSIRAGN